MHFKTKIWSGIGNLLATAYSSARFLGPAFIQSRTFSIFEIVTLYILCALGWGFSIDYFKISVVTSNILFCSLAVVGTIILAVWHQEKKRMRLITRMITMTGDIDIEEKINKSLKANP